MKAPDEIAVDLMLKYYRKRADTRVCPYQSLAKYPRTLAPSMVHPDYRGGPACVFSFISMFDSLTGWGKNSEIIVIK